MDIQPPRANPLDAWAMAGSKIAPRYCGAAGAGANPGAAEPILQRHVQDAPGAESKSFWAVYEGWGSKLG